MQFGGCAIYNITLLGYARIMLMFHPAGYSFKDGVD